MEHKLEITFTWENEDHFTMKAKLDQEDAVSIIKVEENSQIASIWRHIKDLCITYTSDELNKIGAEMMQ